MEYFKTNVAVSFFIRGLTVAHEARLLSLPTFQANCQHYLKLDQKTPKKKTKTNTMIVKI